MDRKEQIEEMAKDLGIAFQLAGTTRFGAVAEVLVNADYRKASADVVEVVRCRECKFSYITRNGFVLCEHGGVQIVDGNHYCSYGERRQDTE